MSLPPELSSAMVLRLASSTLTGLLALAAAVGAGAVAGVDARVELAVLDQRQGGLPGEFEVGREPGPARAVGVFAVRARRPAAALVVEHRPAVDLQRAETLLQGLADFLFDVFLRFGHLSLGQRLLLFQLLLEFLDPLLHRLDLFQNRRIVGQCAAAGARDEEQRDQNHPAFFHDRSPFPALQSSYFFICQSWKYTQMTPPISTALSLPSFFSLKSAVVSAANPHQPALGAA